MQVGYPHSYGRLFVASAIILDLDNRARTVSNCGGAGGQVLIF
jgi:hypothetical protein